MSQLSNETLTEKMEDLKTYLGEKFDRNLEQHDELKEEIKGVQKRQDHTNGDVKALKLWVAGIIGGATVIGALFGVFGKEAIMKSLSDAVLSKIEDKYQIIVDND